jgi:hypothetical protein
VVVVVVSTLERLERAVLAVVATAPQIAPKVAQEQPTQAVAVAVLV